MTFLTLPQRIELERGKREPVEVAELNLDNSKSINIEGLSDDYTSLEVLSMVSVGLESIAGIPNLPSLRNLELSNNLISDGFEALLKCPNLEQLNLSNNKVEALEALIPLAKLSYLRSLDLTNCPVTNLENYRKKMFATLASLKYLDGLDENEEEEPVNEDLANGEQGGVDDDDADEDEDASDVDDEDDGEEELGIEALQRSGELEDDEEDYAPGEDEEAELDDYDDVEDEDDEDVEEDTGANLSGADVTGPRRPASKRRHEVEQDLENGDEEDDAPCAAKHKPADKAVDGHVKNGSTVDQ